MSNRCIVVGSPLESVVITFIILSPFLGPKRLGSPSASFFALNLAFYQSQHIQEGLHVITSSWELE